MSAPRVLLTNDDGPPHSRESPYVFGLFNFLTEKLGWDVKVVLPNSQKSWIGKSFHIKEITTGVYYYPKFPDGHGESSSESRPLKQGEVAEWILLDGTPATCANVALHNLYPDSIDLVISGPNLGRNTSAAFALSSGTLGAAMSASLSKVRSIAVSYGTVIHPTPTTFFDPAHDLAIRIIHFLWNNWGKDDDGGMRNDEVDLYNVNIPLIDGLLTEEGLQVYWTSMWRNGYGRLFQQIAAPPGQKTGDLKFKWSPDLGTLLVPSTVPEASDGWAIRNGSASVTPLRATFAEARDKTIGDIDGGIMKLKL